MAILPADPHGASHEFVRRLAASRGDEHRAVIVEQIRSFYRGMCAMGQYKDYCRCGAFLFHPTPNRVGTDEVMCPACADKAATVGGDEE